MGDKQHVLAKTNLADDDEDDNEDIPSDEMLWQIERKTE